MKVVLKSDAEVLDEVMVVAYGTAKKSTFTGSAATIKNDKIASRQTSNITNALTGQVAGVQTTSNTGQPGKDAEVRIRGIGSISASNRPLYVVDGVPYDGELSAISSTDIESMTVLKDAASNALYGARGANGVILITTKRGANGEARVNFNAKWGVNKRGIASYERITDPGKFYELNYASIYNADLEGYLANGDLAAANAYANQAMLSSAYLGYQVFSVPNGEQLIGMDGKLNPNAKLGYSDGTYTYLPDDWTDELFQNNLRQEYNLSGAAAGEKYDMFASGSYLNEKGYIISSDFERFSGRLKANFTPNKWFRSGINLSASSSEGNYADSAESSYYINPFYTSRMMAPVYPYYVHDAEGNVVMDENGNPTYNLGQQYLSNRHIIYELKNDINRMYTNTMQGQMYATVSFLNDFQFTAKGNLFTSNMKQKNYNNPVSGDGQGNNGRLTQYYQRIKDYTLSQELFWAHHFNKHTVDVLLAHEARSYYASLDYTAKTNMKMTGDNTELSNFSETTYSEGSTTEYATESYLARARYNYDDKYYFDASFRRDGSSRFHPDHRWVISGR